MERLPSIIALECLGAPIAGETTTLRDDETKIESSLLAAPRERKKWEEEEEEKKRERQKDRKTERERSGLSENKSSRDLAACRRKSRVTQMYVADLSARMDLRVFTQRAIDG